MNHILSIINILECLRIWMTELFVYASRYELYNNCFDINYTTNEDTVICIKRYANLLIIIEISS